MKPLKPLEVENNPLLVAKNTEPSTDEESDNHATLSVLRRSQRIKEKYGLDERVICSHSVLQKHRKTRSQPRKSPTKTKHTEAQADGAGTELRRSRGRPRKLPLPTNTKLTGAQTDGAGTELRRSRGRPRKLPTNTKLTGAQTDGAGMELRRSRGRPRKSPFRRSQRIKARCQTIEAKPTTSASLLKSSRRKSSHPIRLNDSYIPDFWQGPPNWLPFSIFKASKPAAGKINSEKNDGSLETINNGCIEDERDPEFRMIGTQTITEPLKSSSTQTETPEDEVSAATLESDPPKKPEMTDVGTDACNIPDPNQTAALELMDYALTQIKIFNEGNPATKYWSISVVVNEAPEPAADCSVETLGDPAAL